MVDSKYRFSLLNKLMIFGLICAAMAQQTHINLKQGTLAGLKVFPDSARSAVYAFLGVPYAEPPIDQLRFAPPKMHSGWNRTLHAISMRPVCPQLSNTIYDEMTTIEILSRPAESNEDCLYLNIWVSENGLRYGNLPVLVVLTGEDMSYDWPRNRITGLDIAADGFVVITIQYRTNIFGWLNIPDNKELIGNFGLLDQSLALDWIQQNIKSLGGNPNQITLLGHGTSGAPCAFYHSLLRNGAVVQPYSVPFSQLILMSGGYIERAFQPVSVVQEASNVIIEKLGCQFEEYSKQLLLCLQSKSVSDLLKAFESMYNHGNGSFRLGPSLAFNFKEILTNSSIMRSFPTTMIGITSNEGAFMQDYWLELARDSYSALKSYIKYTVLRNVLPVEDPSNQSRSKHGSDALNWRYFSDHIEENPIHLLAALQRFMSEYYYEIPFYQLLKTLTNTSESRINNLYAYINDFSNSMDIRGRINLFDGVSHSSDLPFLFGPTLFQQIARRRFNNEEEKLYRKIKSPFLHFIKNGNPLPGGNYGVWIPYSWKNKFIYELGDTWSPSKLESNFRNSQNVHKISQLLFRDQITSSNSRSNRMELSSSYQMPKNNDHPLPSASMRISPYSAHLMRVYGFWEVFLPEVILKDYALYPDNTAMKQRLLYMEASADAARFKHGFFILLSFVLLLLALLCLCVYLLRQEYLPSSSQFHCDL